MPTIQDLCTWLRHNIEDLRLAPDMVTEAAGSTVRFRWHGIANIDGALRGLGAELRPGPGLGEIWLYGHGAREVRLLDDTALIPSRVRARLRCILLAHIDDGQHDWGRGQGLFERPSAGAVA